MNSRYQLNGNRGKKIRVSNIIIVISFAGDKEKS